MAKPKPYKRPRKWREWVTLVIAVITWPWTVAERVRRGEVSGGIALPL